MLILQFLVLLTLENGAPVIAQKLLGNFSTNHVMVVPHFLMDGLCLDLRKPYAGLSFPS
jgi:hypothetical protein